jgi:glycosyltransferase involved in cell wall biosynthesis
MFIPKTVHIIDPGLAGVGGHYFSMNLAIAKKINQIGIKVITYGKIGSVISEEVLNFRQVFRFDVFQEIPVQSTNSYVVENFFGLNKLFFEDLVTINQNDISSDDLIYFQGLTQNQINAVTDWMLSIPENKRPPVIITLRFLNSRMLHNLNRGFAPQIEYLYQQSLQRLLQAHKKTKLVADTEMLCHCFRSISGLEVTLVPSPLGGFENLQSIANDKEFDQKIKILYIGNISPYRGFELLPSIADKILTAKEKTNFVVQINADPSSEQAQLMRPVVEKFSERVKIIYGALSMDDYLSTINSVDIVLLPYHPAYYSFGGSGVFTEAAAMGKVVVATAGTIIDGQAKEYDLPVCFAENYTQDSFVGALLTAIDNLPHFKKLAAISCPQFSAHNSPNNLVRSLLKLI